MIDFSKKKNSCNLRSLLEPITRDLNYPITQNLEQYFPQMRFIQWYTPIFNKIGITHGKGSLIK